jgi:xylulose-5-phosphate/fructose-6-phosphate phosphoketolase
VKQATYSDAADGCLLARRQLPVRRPDLSFRQPVAQAAAGAHGCEAHAAGPLGHDPRAEFHLRASEPGHQEIRPRHDLRLRPRTRRPGGRGNTYLEGTYSEVYPDISQDEAGLQKLFLQFSFPGGIPSHASPECPGSIHEGGELGYSLSHAFGAVFDNPDLIVACVVGDGEAETGPLATAGIPTSFSIRPATARAADPASQRLQDCQSDVLARISRERSSNSCCAATAGRLISSRGTTRLMHEAMARARHGGRTDQEGIQQDARRERRPHAPALADDRPRSPKGWTGPKVVDGCRSKARSARIRCRSASRPPIPNTCAARRLAASYRPEELFDAQGRLLPNWPRSPEGARRMGANPHANGGLLLRDLRMPDFRDYAVAVPSRRARGIGDTRVLGPSCATSSRSTTSKRNFRVFGPDENALQWPGGRVRSHRPPVGRREDAERRVSRARRAG